MYVLKKILQYGWRAIASFVVALIPGVFVAAYNTLWEADIDGVDKMSAHAWSHFLKWTSGYVLTHWDRFLWTAAGIVVVWGALSHGKHFVIRTWKRRILFKRIGIRAYLPRDTAEDKKASWDDCVRFLVHDGNDTICLLGANGWETFGRPEAPLHPVLKQFRGTVRILLVYPFSDALETRAANIGETVDVYRRNIFASIDYCRMLKLQGKDIEVRFFDWPLVWKMIFSRDRLWLQHYEDGKHVDHTAVYSFGREPNPSSLYHPFRAEFNRIWDRAEIVPLNLAVDVLQRTLEETASPAMRAHAGATLAVGTQHRTPGAASPVPVGSEPNA
jgi:hypothetical protein